MRHLALLALALLFAPRVAAAEEAEPIAFDYEAPSSCPSGDWFFAEVRARTPRARPANANERARILVVRIESRDGAFAGRLSIDDAGSRSTPRELRGATCAEVASALALIGALAVDPRASTAPRPAPPETPADPTPPSPPAPAPSASSAPAPAPSAPRSPPTALSSAPSRMSAEPTFAVGAGAEVSAWADAGLSFRVFGDVTLGHPAFRLAIARSLGFERVAPVGSATLVWTTAAAGVCPIRIAIADPLVVRPCAELAGGVLDAEGVGIEQPAARSRPWVAAAAHGRLVWAASRALALEVEGGAMTPFYRESFFFQPGIPVYEPPAVVGFGRFGAAIRFP